MFADPGGTQDLFALLPTELLVCIGTQTTDLAGYTKLIALNARIRAAILGTPVVLQIVPFDQDDNVRAESDLPVNVPTQDSLLALLRPCRRLRQFTFHPGWALMAANSELIWARDAFHESLRALTIPSTRGMPADTLFAIFEALPGLEALQLGSDRHRTSQQLTHRALDKLAAQCPALRSLALYPAKDCRLMPVELWRLRELRHLTCAGSVDDDGGRAPLSSLPLEALATPSLPVALLERLQPTLRRLDMRMPEELPAVCALPRIEELRLLQDGYKADSLTGLLAASGDALTRLRLELTQENAGALLEPALAGLHGLREVTLVSRTVLSLGLVRSLARVAARLSVTVQRAPYLTWWGGSSDAALLSLVGPRLQVLELAMPAGLRLERLELAACPRLTEARLFPRIGVVVLTGCPRLHTLTGLGTASRVIPPQDAPAAELPLRQLELIESADQGRRITPEAECLPLLYSTWGGLTRLGGSVRVASLAHLFALGGLNPRPPHLEALEGLHLHLWEQPPLVRFATLRRLEIVRLNPRSRLEIEAPRLVSLRVAESSLRALTLRTGALRRLHLEGNELAEVELLTGEAPLERVSFRHTAALGEAVMARLLTGATAHLRQVRLEGSFQAMTHLTAEGPLGLALTGLPRLAILAITGSRVLHEAAIHSSTVRWLDMSRCPALGRVALTCPALEVASLQASWSGGIAPLEVPPGALLIDSAGDLVALSSAPTPLLRRVTWRRR
ncbi:hypothetical protein PAPYR_5291 [Paratrimastix pyriformis]|uniref:Uncharacterized protein n=1 Tax=Paratrimastix pyriformis TaxID=342808 RepID=A0ABQ8UK32_9EUKA|nr:hypothetical protein PAPYR_5291 [Paratrimastix pyriformis]